MTDNNSQKVSRTDFTPWRDRETLLHFYHGREYSLLETAQAVGCTEGTISQWCDRLNIETRDAQEARDTGTPEDLTDEETLRGLYWGDHLTCQEIADMYGVTSLTVSNWLRRNGIETRPAHGLGNEDVEMECSDCGETFEVNPSREDTAKYCSRECYHSDQEMPTGEDHWSWRDTPEHRPAGEDWQNLRERIRDRDGYECQLCGVSESDMDRTLDVHHLRRVRDMDNLNDAVNVDESELVSLCRSCHRRAEKYAPLLPDTAD